MTRKGDNVERVKMVGSLCFAVTNTPLRDRTEPERRPLEFGAKSQAPRLVSMACADPGYGPPGEAHEVRQRAKPPQAQRFVYGRLRRGLADASIVYGRARRGVRPIQAQEALRRFHEGTPVYRLVRVTTSEQIQEPEVDGGS